MKKNHRQSKRETTSRKVFQIFNYVLLLLYAVVAIFPVLNLAAISLSAPNFVSAGKVSIIPMGMNFHAYSYILSNEDFFRAFIISIYRVILGVGLNMLMILLVAYPLSRPRQHFKSAGVYSWFFIVTMLFSGGLIPMYILVKSLGISDSIWALVIPGAVPVYSVILMMNFFRQVPEDFREAAIVDGASEMRILFRIYIPVTLPSFTTVLLFTIIGHWNSWFDGVLYMSTIDRMPLQSYLQTVTIQHIEGDMSHLLNPNYTNQQSLDAARLFLAVIPIMIAYFSLQKYFVKGLTLGGVKA